MFSSTVHQVVRSLGKDTLLPVPNLDASDNIYPLSIVLKETRRHLLFWTKHKCYTTEFKLTDILEDPTKQPVVKIDEKIFCKGFNRSTNLSLKGKFGVELAKELVDIVLEGARSVIVQSPLGDLQKDEVELQPFLDEINSRKQCHAIIQITGVSECVEFYAVINNIPVIWRRSVNNQVRADNPVISNLGALISSLRYNDNLTCVDHVSNPDPAKLLFTSFRTSIGEST